MKSRKARTIHSNSIRVLSTPAPKVNFAVWSEGGLRGRPLAEGVISSLDDAVPYMHSANLHHRRVDQRHHELNGYGDDGDGQAEDGENPYTR